MSRDSKFNRRSFVKICASAVAMITASPGVLAQQDGTLRRYSRARLVDKLKRPVKLADLKVGENYLFHYPYISTPCFLLNLGKPVVGGLTLQTEDGRKYQWQGGVGPQRSLVAFSAICAHKMTHPARSVSFINYRHKTVNFKDKAKEPARRAEVIYCCSEFSVYDAAQGARVLGGPAPQPLAAVLLDYDNADGTLYATGTYGGDMFEKFLRDFYLRLTLEFGTTSIRQQVDNTATVMRLADYSRTQVFC